MVLALCLNSPLAGKRLVDSHLIDLCHFHVTCCEQLGRSHRARGCDNRHDEDRDKLDLRLVESLMFSPQYNLVIGLLR